MKTVPECEERERWGQTEIPRELMCAVDHSVRVHFPQSTAGSPGKDYWLFHVVTRKETGAVGTRSQFSSNLRARTPERALTVA